MNTYETVSGKVEVVYPFGAGRWYATAYITRTVQSAGYGGTEVKRTRVIVTDRDWPADAALPIQGTEFTARQYAVGRIDLPNAILDAVAVK